MNKKRILAKIITTLIFITIITGLFNNLVANASSPVIIVINPGHGGSYTGCANNAKGLVEKDLTLKTGNYLKEYLSKYDNVKIIMTHDGVNFPNGDAGDLSARCMIARNNNADLYVSLHIDDIADTSINGATVYCTYREDLDKYYKGMQRLGNSILENLGKIGIQSRGVLTRKCQDQVPKYQYITTYTDSKGNIVHDQADYYNDIRACMKGDSEGYGEDFRDGSGVPAVLIEHCFINNAHDVQYIDSEEDLKKLAEADGKAIVQYFNLKLKSETTNLPFTDVKEGSWYYNSVKYVNEQAIMTGLNATTFAPNNNLTRGQMVTLLYRMEGSPKVTGALAFPDVQDSNKYYYKAVKWTVDNGIVSGYANGTFGPTDNITRAQLAVILFNYAEKNGKDVSKRANLTEFSDNDQVASWAKNAVSWAVAEGIISGNVNKQTGVKTIDPRQNATRAQVASIIERYCKNIGK